jgi:hypothetical protein
MDKLKTPPLLAWDVGAAEVGLIFSPFLVRAMFIFIVLLVLLRLL